MGTAFTCTTRDPSAQSVYNWDEFWSKGKVNCPPLPVPIPAAVSGQRSTAGWPQDGMQYTYPGGGGGHSKTNWAEILLVPFFSKDLIYGNVPYEKEKH
jgi:hypothetical protein